MASKRLEPKFRPAVVILLENCGDEVYQSLSRLCAGLSPLLPNTPAYKCIEFIGVKRDAGSLRALRLPLLAYTATLPGGAPADAAQGAAPDATPDNFSVVMETALRSVQDARTKTVVRAAGYINPLSRAQILVIGSYLDAQTREQVTTELQTFLRHFAATTGIDGEGETLITYLLSNPPAPGELRRQQRGNAARQQSPRPARSIEDMWADFEAERIREDMIRHVVQASSQLLTFPLYYAESTQSGMLYTPERVRYLIAEAAFAMIATGITEASSFPKAVQRVPGATTTIMSLGSLGAALLRFPRADAEVYCVARLGAEALGQWAKDTPELDIHESDRRTQAVTLKAKQFVKLTLNPWLKDIQHPERANPTPGAIPWPTRETLQRPTRDALNEFRRVTKRINDYLDYDRLADRVDQREQDTRSDTHTDAWAEVTRAAFGDAEGDYGLWEATAIAAWGGVESEIIRQVNQLANDVWLRDLRAWEDAAVYIRGIDDELKALRQALAGRRQHENDEYLKQLKKYATLASGPWAIPAGQVIGADGAEQIVVPQGGQPAPAGPGVANPQPNAGNAGNAGGAGAPPVGGIAVGVGAAAAGAGAAPNNGVAGGAGAPQAPQPAVQPIETPEEQAQRLIDLLARRATYYKTQLPQLATLAGVSVALSPALFTLAHEALPMSLANQPLGLGVAIGGVGVVLTAGSLVFRNIADRRLARAREQHVEFMQIVIQHRRAVREARLLAATLIAVHVYVRQIRQRLENWRDTLSGASAELERLATQTSANLFDDERPMATHDVFVGNGVRLQRDMHHTAGRELEPIHLAVTQHRVKSSTHLWQTTLQGINEEMRRRFQQQNTQVISMLPEEFTLAVRHFLQEWLPAQHIIGDISKIGPALSQNAHALDLWREVVEHARPMYGEAGDVLPYVAGNVENLDATTKLGVEPAAEQLTTLSDEWALMARLRQNTITS